VYKVACATLDELLWSLTAKERHAQRRRVAAMIPGLMVALRQGCTSVGLSREHTADFFDALFHLHLGVLKQTEEVARSASAVADASPKGATEDTRPARQPTDSKSLYDFVSEMIVGSWIAFVEGQRETVGRLWWVSPMRTRYVFSDRAVTHGKVLSPEQLAHELEAGTASVVVEPIPLFERAVSAAFDAVGGRRDPVGA
jgi:hypothetical protein